MYLALLRKKPRALYNTDFYQALPKQWQGLLEESSEPEQILAAVESLLKRSNVQYSTDIASFLEYYNYDFVSRTADMNSNDRLPLPSYHPDLSIYDRLLDGGGKV